MQQSFATALIHGGIDGDSKTGAVSVPIYQTSTYRQSGLGENSGYEYSRTGNPTRESLERLIAELEGGAAGFAFASGMAAITAVLSLFQSGDKIIISSNVYGGTFRVLDKVFKNFGLTYEIVDTSDLQLLESRIAENVKALIVESPANPLLTITDLAAASEIARRHGLKMIVDNTFMTPYLQKPLNLGADIVVHSATKYLGGHSDLVAGLVAVRDAETAERLGFLQNATGGVLGPFDSWLLIRGIKTLSVRMDRHLENASYLADFLRNHDAVAKVYYPGFEDFPGYEIQKRQASGAGAMISFVLSGRYDIHTFFRSVRLIALAESLGGVESLVCHPASMTHASIPCEIRQKVGIVDNLVRLSVGIEDKKDLADDLSQAFGQAIVGESK
ncbi:aminotransferase class I/II-fold pyridoxal phosphate-dependent enzyme [Caproiciproducens sp. NJN-50]|uniref:trans-sulfuration enzyme family protein n=1 Tax=Acutalibacteraceae TaxID=3082771 RepID=UPI000FFE0FB5|nr:MULTISPECIES: aminotransferase class I/II-fold pyridoxal phosphate-dependent enzyme [Acutalibacteraceae]QAT50421.1 aminotransferase class I/II-fold pyridoxal phosphate-dependent enzyme [Caproiciproducens sp. NJN-50]